MNKNLGDLIHVCITPWGNAKFGLRFTVECHAYLFWGLCYLYTPLVILIELHEFLKKKIILHCTAPFSTTFCLCPLGVSSEMFKDSGDLHK